MTKNEARTPVRPSLPLGKRDETTYWLYVTEESEAALHAGDEGQRECVDDSCAGPRPDDAGLREDHRLGQVPGGRLGSGELARSTGPRIFPNRSRAQARAGKSSRVRSNIQRLDSSSKGDRTGLDATDAG